LVGSAILVGVGIKLADNGDVISQRTGLGGLFIGVMLVASATSLPELLTTINAVQQNVPDIAAGNLFGSNIFNMLLIAMIDLMRWRERILQRVAKHHILPGLFATLMAALAIFFVHADINIHFGWIGLDSLIIIAVYFVCMRVIQTISVNENKTLENEPVPDDTPSLMKGIIGFALATAVLVVVMPFLVSSSAEIAVITGLGNGFIGTALVAMITSLPELATTFAAVRIGAYDMAVGNLFGSNMFNMFALGLSDVVITKSRIFNLISPDFALVGMIAIIMTLIGTIGNQARLPKKIWFIELDSLLLIITYFVGMYVIYLSRIGM
ncbi:MAG: hypothetical protein U1B80_05920, partial [Anaerolineaceae bacterium]|nr:hypothetical protein [Anaerolineaceae bacterium]